MGISRNDRGEWELSVGPGLSVARIQDGIAALEDDLRGGPKEAIGKAIVELLGATDRPPQLDEGAEAARVLALRQMAWDYPIDVVQAACRNWRRVPSHGRWWPTEQDLRAQCEPLVKARQELRVAALKLRDRMAAQERAAEHAKQEEERASMFAGSVHNQFRERMRERMTASRHAAYFDASRMKFLDNPARIVVTAMVDEDVLNNEGGDILQDLGLKLFMDHAQFLNDRPYVPEPTTAEEDREIAAGLRKVFQGRAGL